MMSKKRPNQTSISGFFSKVPKISANENQSQINSNNLSQNDNNPSMLITENLANSVKNSDQEQKCLSNDSSIKISDTFMLAQKKGGGRDRVIFFSCLPPQ